jgi:monovalent cation/hydrogen antiporter
VEEIAVLGAVAVLVIVAVAHFAPRLGVAAPVLLVLVGIVASYVPGAPEVEVDPHLILAVVLPPILYSAAITVPASDFRRNFKAISALAVVLVLVSAFVSGLVVYWLLPGLDLAAAIALGAVVSPPDAVAATSIGKRLGLPPRLVTVLEGEGLVNDATALVMLRSAVAATAGAVSFWGVIGDFALAVLVGVVVGAVIGVVSVRIRSRLDDPVLTTVISLTVPFVAFAPAEKLHASGVLAVVVAGLITGHQSAQHFSAQDRVTERINWRTIQVLLENGVFLLMGYEIHVILDDVNNGDGVGVGRAVLLGLLVTVVLVVLRMGFMLPLVAWLRHGERRAIAAAPYLSATMERLDGLPDDPDSPRHAARVRFFQRRLRTRISDAEALAKEGLGLRGGAVLGWSGMRGVVTVAAAQSLPSDVPYRSELILIAFTVALVTLVGQGSTLPLLIRRLGVRGTDAEADQRELANLVAELAEVMGARLDSPDLRRAGGGSFSPAVVEQVRDFNLDIARRLADTDTRGRSTIDERRELRRVLLEAGQLALLDARASGTYAARTVERAQAILDAETIRLEAGSTSGH